LDLPSSEDKRLKRLKKRVSDKTKYINIAQNMNLLSRT